MPSTPEADRSPPCGAWRCAGLGRRLARSLAALALAAMSPSLSAQPTPPSTVAMPLTPLAPGRYMVQGQSAMGSAANQNFISNAAFVVADGGVLVIDALGSPPLARQLLDRIRGVTALPVRYVVVSHCHADHIYGLQVFRDLGARIVAHVGCRDYLASDAAKLRLAASREALLPWVDEHTRLITPDVWVGEPGRGGDLVLRIGASEFLVRHAGPSHTTEDLVVFDAAQRVLFAGDIVFRGRVPYVGQADSQAWVAALARLIDLAPRVLVPGHGPPSTDPATDLRETRDYLVYLRQTMGSAAQALEPFDEAYARTDWSRFSSWPLFAAINRMNAYNTYLLMEHLGR